jgi:hypothetical protein
MPGRSSGACSVELLTAASRLCRQPVCPGTAFQAARDRFGEVLRVPGPITETVQGLDGDAHSQVLALHHVYLLTDDLTFPLLATVNHEVLVPTIRVQSPARPTWPDSGEWANSGTTSIVE